MFLWRISNYPSLSGEGGKLASARWHSKGRPIVYLADSPSGALLETLVHLKGRAGKIPETYTLLQIEASPSVLIEDLSIALDSDWLDHEAITRFVGDAWLESGTTALAGVPSAIMPKTTNYLLNPLHPLASKVRIIDAIQACHDVRLTGLVSL